MNKGAGVKRKKALTDVDRAVRNRVVAGHHLSEFKAWVTEFNAHAERQQRPGFFRSNEYGEWYVFANGSGSTVGPSLFAAAEIKYTDGKTALSLSTKWPPAVTLVLEVGPEERAWLAAEMIALWGRWASDPAGSGAAPNT